MKRVFKPFLGLFFACSLFACSGDKDVVDEQLQDQKRPTVDYEVVQGDDPFTFTFQNKSANYKELEWRFGDDSLSKQESPSHVFLANGKYEVNLKATAADGSTARKLVVVTVDPEKVAKIRVVTTGVPREVNFSAVASGAEIKSVAWDFGDGTKSEALSPNKVYEEGKLFTATATITTKKGSIASIKRVVTSNGVIVDVTDQFLLNTGPKFRTSARFGSRWGVVADWRVNAAVRQREGGMGGWDEWEGNSMSMESWGGEPDIENGKIEQTSLVPLPAGQYYYEMKFHDFQIKDLLYNVVTTDGNLPDVDKVTTDTKVVGYTKFMGNAPLLVYTSFKLNQASPVTIGFVSTFLQNDQNFKLTYVRIYRQVVE
ncbi:MAG: DUF5013 domain-containing protein [Bacteroidota bacterium]